MSFQQKARDYWSTVVADKYDPRALWSKLNDILSPPASQSYDRLCADDFSTHFMSKIQAIRNSTAGITPSVVESRATVTAPLSPVTVQEVIKLLGKLPAKHCSLDPVPIWLVNATGGIPCTSYLSNAMRRCSRAVCQPARSMRGRSATAQKTDAE